MNRSAKEQVYSNVYQSLKENQAISNLGYPEERNTTTLIVVLDL